MALKRFIYDKVSDELKDSYTISYQKAKKIHMDKLIEIPKRFIFLK